MPKKNKISLIGVVTAALLAVPAGSGAAASQPAQAGQSAAECSALGANTAGAEQGDAIDMTQIGGEQAEQLAADVTELIDSGEVTVNAPAEALVRDGAKAYQVEAGEEQQQVTSVSFPISGSYSEPLSNLTVLFDAEGAVVQYSETLISEGDTGNFHITSYADGELTNSEDTGISYMDDEQLRGEMTAGNEAVAESNSTAACLASVLGVSVAVGAVIAYACAGSCSVPMTPVTAPICAACIGGFAVVGGASITAIANCF